MTDQEVEREDMVGFLVFFAVLPLVVGIFASVAGATFDEIIVCAWIVESVAIAIIGLLSKELWSTLGLASLWFIPLFTITALHFGWIESFVNSMSG